MATRDNGAHLKRGRRQASSLDSELIDRCCMFCVETAHSLIEAIHTHLNTLYKSSGWHSVYCKLALGLVSP